MKSLAEMTAEVVENNTRLGWYGDDTHAVATFPEAMALLHSEVSEALEAWRKWGLEDPTPRAGLQAVAPGDIPTKPEGVGSEFADIFIRLLDDAQLFGPVNLEKATWSVFGMYDSLPANLNVLHNLISRVSESYVAGGEFWSSQLADVLGFLRQLCEMYGIDLDAEYERKMAYNRTRPYRHGGKAL